MWVRLPCHSRGSRKRRGLTQRTLQLPSPEVVLTLVYAQHAPNLPQCLADVLYRHIDLDTSRNDSCGSHGKKLYSVVALWSMPGLGKTRIFIAFYKNVALMRLTD
jgi:hypothetical protein